MKKYIISILISLFSIVGYSQQLPLSNLYQNNAYMVNPALAGIKGCTQFYINHRRQWTGFEGAPVTSFISGDGEIAKNMGIGVKLTNDQANLINKVYGLGSFAYSVNLTSQSKLSLGVSAGFFQNSINLNNAVIEDESEEIVSNYSGLTYETDLGIAYSSDKMTIGVAIPRFIESKTNISSPSFSTGYTLTRHALIYANYIFNINDNVNFKPSILLRWLPSIDVQYDLNTDFVFKDKFMVGLGYRKEEGILLRAGALLNDRYSFNYAYEFFPTNITSYSGGSHEIQLGIKLCKKEKKISFPVFAEEYREGEVKEQEESIQKDYKLLIKEDHAAEKLTFHNLKDFEEYLQSIEKENSDSVAKLRKEMVENKDQRNFQITIKPVKWEVHKEKKEKHESHFSAISETVSQKDFNLIVGFDLNSDVISGESFSELDKIAKVLREHPALKIEIIGHSCDLGDKEINTTISILRAEKIRKYLLDKGATDDQMFTKGVLDVKPIYPNTSEENRRKNRRVDFKLINFK